MPLSLSLSLIAVQRQLRPKLLLLGNHCMGLSSPEELFSFYWKQSDHSQRQQENFENYQVAKYLKERAYQQQ